MGEKVKDKNAGQAHDEAKKDLDAGLEGTFPASDPVSATRTPEDEKPGSKTPPGTADGH